MRWSAKLCFVLALLAVSDALVSATTAVNIHQQQKNKQQQEQRQEREQHALQEGANAQLLRAARLDSGPRQLHSRGLAPVHGSRPMHTRSLLQAGSSSAAVLPSGGLLQNAAGSWSVNFDWQSTGQTTASDNTNTKAIKVQVGPAVSPAPGATSSSSSPALAFPASTSSQTLTPQQLQNTSTSPTAPQQQAGDLCSSFKAAANGTTPPSSSSIDYYYMRPDGYEGNPLGMPLADSPGLPWMSRWVMCGWSVSNFSSPTMLSDAAMEQVQGLVNNFSAMAPGQVRHMTLQKFAEMRPR
jgi:hypothetical protein